MMKPVSSLLLMLCLGTALWCDGPANAQDAAAPAVNTPVAPAVDAPAPAAPAPFELPNGDMTEGDDLPTGWQPPGKRTAAKAIRDKTLFHSAPASLCVTRSDPDPRKAGNATLLVHNGDTKKFVLSGFVGSELGVRFSLFYDYITEGDGILHSQSIDLPPHEDKWLPFSQTVTLPSDVTEFTLAFSVQGGGSAWLDDLKVSAPDAPTPPAPNP